MYEKNEEDIRYIEEWLQTQKFLPKDLSRHIVCTFLLGCEGDRTKTKKVISNYFYARQSIPELFTRRDPLLRENLLAWKSSCFVPLKEKQDGCRVYLGAAISSENYEFVAFVKQMFMCFDLLIKNNEWGNGDRILILSYDKLELQNFATYTHYITAKTAECERDNYLPGKLRAVHNVHIPPFMKKIHEKFQPHLRPDDEKQTNGSKSSKLTGIFSWKRKKSECERREGKWGLPVTLARDKSVRMADLKMCGICCGSICDRYIMRVADTSYHERCLLCSVCGIRLSHTCFTRDSKLYCRLDYDRLYAKKCLGCSERISADELVMRALDSVFHLRCFICVVCGVRLQRGDQFVIKQGQLFCRPDYEKEVEMLQGYAQGDFACDDIVQSSRTQDGRRGPKRPRTILTTQQRKAFKASFEVSPKPCRKVREALAKDTGLSVRIVQGPKRQHTMLTTQQREAFKEYFRLCPKPGCKVREGLAKETGLSARIVQVWFQNQRAKMKKIQKKARQENKTKDGDSGDDRKPKLKEEDSSPNGTFLNDDSDTNNTLPNSENYLHSNSGSEDHLQYLPIKEEMLDNDDTSFLKITSHGEHHHPREFVAEAGAHEKMNSGFVAFPYSGSPLEQAAAAHQIFINQAPPLGLNPIDRLYSMQNSYFCGEDSPMVDQ